MGFFKVVVALVILWFLAPAIIALFIAIGEGSKDSKAVPIDTMTVHRKCEMVDIIHSPGHSERGEWCEDVRN